VIGPTEHIANLGKEIRSGVGGRVNRGPAIVAVKRARAVGGARGDKGITCDERLNPSLTLIEVSRICGVVH